LPEGVEDLFTAHRLSALALAAGVTEIVSGPKATALRIATNRRPDLVTALEPTCDRRWSEDRLIVDKAEDLPHDATFIESLLTEMAAA